MSREEDIQPSTLAHLDDDELAFIESTRRKKDVRRIKIEPGHTWTLRLLPVELGKSKRWFARLAFHWINKFPVLCSKFTHPDFGGDPQSRCLLCESSERLNASADRAISSVGYRLQYRPQWLVYSCVFEKDNGKEIEKMRGDERWLAWEFPLLESDFEILYKMYKRSLARNTSPEFRGILDFYEGNDIMATMSKRKGLNFEKSPQCSIDREDRIAETVDKIFATVRPPEYKMPDDEMIDQQLEKIDILVREAKSRKRGDEYNDLDSGRDFVDDRRESRSRSRGDDDDRHSRDRDDRGRHEDDDRGRHEDVDDRRSVGTAVAERGREKANSLSDTKREELSRGASAVINRRSADDDDRGRRPAADDSDDRSTRSREDDRRDDRRTSRPEETRSAPPSVGRPELRPPPARVSTPPSASRTTTSHVAPVTPPLPKATQPTQASESSVDDDDNVTEEDKDLVPANDVPAEDVKSVDLHGDEPPALKAEQRDRLMRGINAAKDRR